MVWHTEHPSWRSGPWSLELRGDELADIAVHGRVVLRSIRAVVRDADWNTADLVLDRVRSTDVTLTLHVRSEGLGSSFSGVVRVEARASGLRVLLDLEAGVAFDTNRTGLVVLHPPSLAGVPVQVRHPDGTGERTAFPRAISPHQPMRDIAGLTWEVPGATVDVAFDGDVFEMEDQRNWTDASYKTYSRPLDLPFPYRIEAGERVRQSVTIEVAGEPAAPEADEGDVLMLHDGGRFPQILVGAATAPDPAPRVSPVGDGLVVELDLSTPTWPAALARAAASAVPLDVRVVLGGDADALDAAAAALRGFDVLRVAAFPPDGDARHVSDTSATAALRAAMDRAGVRLPVAGGSRSHFTELSRERRRLPNDLDGILMTVTPLFHATGTEQLVESVAMQRLVATQAVGYAGGTPVHIGPVSLRPRFNDVATGPQPAPTRGDLSEGYGAEFTGTTDERQAAPELAAWTVAGAAARAVPGGAALAVVEEWGPRGIRSADGTDLPVASALRELCAGSGGELLWGDSPDGLVWAIGHRQGGSTALLVANLDRAARSVTVTVASDIRTVDVAAGAVRHIASLERAVPCQGGGCQGPTARSVPP